MQPRTIPTALTFFMYMANMSWNSAMNVPDTLKALTAKRDDGEYVIPHIIYSDAYDSEMVHYADLILPDTTYLERWDCISMLDRPISEADGPADSIRQPVVDRNATCALFKLYCWTSAQGLAFPA
jgi:anaerobic selenocysteine-containing dehydrogenase